MDGELILEVVLWALVVAFEAAVGAYIWAKVTGVKGDHPQAGLILHHPDDDNNGEVKTELRTLILNSKMSTDDKCDACEMIDRL